MSALSEPGQKRLLSVLVEMLQEVHLPSGKEHLSVPSTVIALEGVWGGAHLPWGKGLALLVLPRFTDHVLTSPPILTLTTS